MSRAARTVGNEFDDGRAIFGLSRIECGAYFVEITRLPRAVIAPFPLTRCGMCLWYFRFIAPAVCQSTGCQMLVMFGGLYSQLILFSRHFCAEPLYTRDANLSRTSVAHLSPYVSVYRGKEG